METAATRHYEAINKYAARILQEPLKAEMVSFRLCANRSPIGMLEKGPNLAQRFRK